MIHSITAHIEENIVRANLQENISIFNQIIHIKAIGNKLIRLPAKPLTPENIRDVVKIPLRADWYYSIFTND